MILNRVGIGTGGCKNLSVERLHAAYDLGMNFVDTAPNYGTEEVVGQSIADRRNSVFVATKVGPEHLKFGDFISSCDNSLRRLNIHHIDLLQVHWPNPAAVMEDTAEGFRHLLKQGKIIKAGVCNVTLPQLKKWVELIPELFSVQNEYNLLDNTVEREGMLSYCFANNIQFIAYSPFDGGRLPFHMLDEAFDGYSGGSLAIAKLLAAPSAMVIPRVSKRASSWQGWEKISSGHLMWRWPQVERIATDKIDLRHSPYKNVTEATHNYLGRCPAPLDMARDGTFLKPLKVVGPDHILVEGFMRYWAWVLANDNKPVEVLVRE